MRSEGNNGDFCCPSLAPMFPEIGDYALIGNCRTAALVSNRGAVEWLCVPNFSGAPVFGAILDRDAGHFSIRPVGDCRVTRRYLPGTNVLETTFHGESGALRLTDCLTLPREREPELYPEHELLRRVECISGVIELEVSFALRRGFYMGELVLTPRCIRGGLGFVWDVMR